MPKPKRERIRTEKQVTRKLEHERRGSLEGEYKPFLLIHDFTSIGRVSRIKYGKREAHLMSDLETAVFQELLWHPDVLEIREQCPLDRTVTLRIAEEMNVNHPKLSGDGGLMPLTSDFVVDFRNPRDGITIRRAIAVKPITSLVRGKNATSGNTTKRVTNTIDKLEIERRYWAEKQCDWYLITDGEICKTRKANIEILLGTEDPADEESDLWIERLVETFVELQAAGDSPIKDLRPPFMRAGHLPRSLLIRATRLLCKYRFLEFDMSKLFSPDMTASEFRSGPSALALEGVNDAAGGKKAA